MKTFVGLMMSSATFGIVISIAYWFIAHGIQGTLFLGFMAAALVFCAGYAVIAERHADLAGDDKNSRPDQVVGEDLGVFTPHSAYPILVALCVWVMLLGVLWSPFIAVLAALALGLSLWRMGAESARTPEE